MVVFEVDGVVGDWKLSRGVLGVEDSDGLLACVAVGRRGFGRPGLDSAWVRGTDKSKLYLFWLRVSNIESFNTVGMVRWRLATYGGSAFGL